VSQLERWTRAARIVLLAGALSILSVANASAQEEIKLGGRRIVGGEPTVIQEHPWQVAFTIRKPSGTFLCGGAIIRQKWVLTAAHCFSQDTRAGDVKLKAGVTNFVTEGTWAETGQLVIHQNYNAATQINDIALVRLNLAANGRIIPLVSPPGLLSPGEPLEVTGWGATSEGGSSSRNLLKATVPFVDNEACNAPSAYGGRVSAGMLCAGYREGGIDACQGDSGGPLVWKTPDGPVLVGIVSFGDGCARKLKYGVYTRVSAYRDWILGMIAANPG
jgi:trypsin